MVSWSIARSLEYPLRDTAALVLQFWTVGAVTRLDDDRPCFPQFLHGKGNFVVVCARKGVRLEVANLCILAMSICAWPGAVFRQGQEPPAATCSLKIELVDSQTGQPLSGTVQVLGDDGQGVARPRPIRTR